MRTICSGAASAAVVAALLCGTVPASGMAAAGASDAAPQAGTAGRRAPRRCRRGWYVTSGGTVTGAYRSPSGDTQRLGPFQYVHQPVDCSS